MSKTSQVKVSADVLCGAPAGITIGDAKCKGPFGAQWSLATSRRIASTNSASVEPTDL